MTDRSEMREFRLFPVSNKPKILAAILMALTLASCASESAREAEIAAAEAERVAAEQRAAQVAAAQERARAVELQRQRGREAAERARVEAEREAERQRQLAAAEARAEQERQRREAAEQRERERLAAIAAAQAERQAKIDRIAQLEQQIATLQAEAPDDAARTATMVLAVEAAEELLAALTEEQSKYEDTDDQGNTVEPLAKDLIAELESRKNQLLQQANSQ